MDGMIAEIGQEGDGDGGQDETTDLFLLMVPGPHAARALKRKTMISKYRPELNRSLTVTAGAKKKPRPCEDAAWLKLTLCDQARRIDVPA
jgi:hypothetical protein